MDIIHDSNANYNEVPYYPVSGTGVLIYLDLCFFSPDARGATGEVVHLDWELLEVVDAGVQLGDQHQEVGSLVMTMLCQH